MRGGFDHGAVRGDEVGTIDLDSVEVGKSGKNLRDTAAGGLPFHGNRNGVAVVFDKIYDGQLVQTGDVQGLPEFSFAGGSFAGANQCHFGGFGAKVNAGVRTPDGLRKLGARWR